MTRHITEDLEISSNDSDEEYSFFIERSKTSHHYDNFVLCELLPSLDYKEFFLTTLSISYKAYQKFCCVMFFLLDGLTYNTKHKPHSLPKPFCIVYQKILNSWKNSQLTGKFPNHKKILNSQEISQLNPF